MNAIHGIIFTSTTLAFAAGACVNSVPLAGRPCPCASGYTCCTTTNQCLPAGQLCPAGGAGGTPDGIAGGTTGAGGQADGSTGGSPAGGAGGGSTSTGGVTGTGGVTNAGGATSSGGVTSAGGLASTAGATSSGGVTRAGGSASTGGVTSSGGVTRTGGIIGSGGITNTGGITSSGGVTNTGGVASSSGVTNTGGVASSGGVTVSGGMTSTGGITSTGGGPTGHFQMENLNRGVVAVTVAGGVYVGWRMFGHEYDTTASNVSYNLYRDGTKIATVTDSTNYLDASGTASSSYTVTAVIKGIEGAQSPAATPWAQNYLSIPVTPPPRDTSGSTYEANDGSPGDLDGDGQYDIVLKWDPIPPETDVAVPMRSHVFLDGYTLAGTLLWRIDLGPNIHAGAQYTQFSVYDLDGDGKAEVACKTAPGTKDGTGQYLSKGPAATDDDSANYQDLSGYILTGPEYLTVFSGATGEELATVDYPLPRGNPGDWGSPDNDGIRSDRFNGGVAFVSDAGSGKTPTGRPSIIQQRGFYSRLAVSAYNWRDGVLSKAWIFDSNDPGNDLATGQGDHSAMPADTDNDGAQEIITGSTTIGSEGTLRCTTRMGHGDALHVGELVVGKGISVFTVHELGGYDVHDGSTCAFYVEVTGGGDDGRGVAEYIDATETAAAGFWSQTYTSLYSCADGSTIGSKPSSLNFLIYWDADESRELEDGTSIAKYGGGALLSATGCSGNNGTKNTPTLTADLLGDWREEIVWRESTNAALRVYTTTDVTKRRIYTLMHDPTYRAQVAFEQSGYNQPPHTGFHIGAGMADPPNPDIYVR